jgi:hypothetical protein
MDTLLKSSHLGCRLSPNGACALGTGRTLAYRQPLKGSRRELVDATLAALEHTVGRDQHLPYLRRLVENRVGPVTFAEIAEALAAVDLGGRSPDWREEWAELVDALRRAAQGN